MKKIAAGTLTVMGAFALASCGHNSQQEASTATPKAAVVAASSAGAPQVIDASVLASAKPTGQPCSFDSDPNVVVGKRNDLRGWFVGSSQRPAGKFSFVLIGERDFTMPAETGALRPDVGAYMKDPALSAAGFAFSSTFESVPKGSYDVRLMVKEGQVSYFCDTGKKIVVEP